MRKVSEKQAVKNLLKKEQAEKMRAFFLSLWDKQEKTFILTNGTEVSYVTCFESNTPLLRHMYRENSCCYSHILPKSIYPQYAFEEWNVKIVHPDDHAQYESFAEKAPKQWALKQQLLKQIQK